MTPTLTYILAFAILMHITLMQISSKMDEDPTRIDLQQMNKGVICMIMCAIAFGVYFLSALFWPLIISL